MGIFDGLKQAVRKEHLLISADGSLPIDHIEAWSDAKKIDYAWKVYNSLDEKYTTDHKNGSLKFLCGQFKIPEGLHLANKLSNLYDLISRKTESNTTTSASVHRIAAVSPIFWPKTTEVKERALRFIKSVNNDIEIMNKEIARYNSTTTKIDQFKLLQEIYRQSEAIGNKYSDIEITQCPSYCAELHNKLFLNLQKQFSFHNVLSMKDVLDLDPNPMIPRTEYSLTKNTLPEIIANMSPEKISFLLDILTEHDFRQQLANLYSNDESGQIEFQAFLQTHQIEYLGGMNSRNFKVTPNDGDRPFVLKVDNRKGAPRSTAVHLREGSLRDTFIPIAAQRQTSFGEQITRTILVTAYCDGGDIESHENTHCKDDEQRIKNALSIYGQMGAILEKIRLDGCYFPDMKNSNWLIDSSGIVCLSDDKSFLFTNQDLNVDRTINSENWYGYLSTRAMNPPEFAYLIGNNTIPADAMHAYMLGKNLYQYLSGCDSNYLYNHCHPSTFDYSAPVFQTNKGRELQSLILKLAAFDYKNRISVKQAVHELERIEVLTDSPPSAKKTTVNAIEQSSISKTKDMKSRLMNFKDTEPVDPIQENTGIDKQTMGKSNT